jgi:hypothetical protein
MSVSLEVRTVIIGLLLLQQALDGPVVGVVA